ncbi:MAG TPA: hypothetical protein VGN44_05580 [Candidatus Angelobacter sp.]|jgi:hypothetical protein
MKEEDFDALMKGRSFGTEDATRVDAQLRRIFTLGAVLWGRTSDDLQRQLLAPHPDIPLGIGLSDLRELLRNVELMLAAFHDEKGALASISIALSSPTITIGTQQFTAWEARCEIVRRAIQYLETR